MSLVSTTLLLVQLDAHQIDVWHSTRRGGWHAAHREHGVLAGPEPTAEQVGHLALKAKLELDQAKAA